MFVDLENFDFTLQENSPCIDAGDPEETDPDGSIRDIGAFGFGSEIYPGDLNADGIIDILDLIILINMILNGEYSTIADWNEDGVINILDIVIYRNIILGN